MVGTDNEGGGRLQSSEQYKDVIHLLFGKSNILCRAVVLQNAQGDAFLEPHTYARKFSLTFFYWGQIRIYLCLLNL